MNDHKKQTFKTNMGIDATIQHSKMGAEKASIPNRQLCDLGLSFVEIVPHLAGYQYMGSAAVHVFLHAGVLEQLDFISQCDAFDLYKCPMQLANRGIQHLDKTCKELYTGKRSRVRSGW